MIRHEQFTRVAFVAAWAGFALAIAALFVNEACAELEVQHVQVAPPAQKSRVPAATAQGEVLAAQAVSAVDISADGKFITMWTDMRRPLDISMDREGILYISEGGVDGLSPRVSLMDKQGNVVARWDSLSAHGSWVDAHGDIYMALGARMRVDKYVRQG